MLLGHCKIHLAQKQNVEGLDYLKRSMVLAALRTFPYTPVPGPSASLNRIGVFLCLAPIHTKAVTHKAGLQSSNIWIIPLEKAWVEWFDSAEIWLLIWKCSFIINLNCFIFRFFIIILLSYINFAVFILSVVIIVNDYNLVRFFFFQSHKISPSGISHHAVHRPGPSTQPCWCVSRCSDHPAGSSVAVPASPAERPESFSLCRGPLTRSASESESLSAGANGPPAPPDCCCSEPCWSASRGIVKITIKIQNLGAGAQVFLSKVFYYKNVIAIPTWVPGF